MEYHENEKSSISVLGAFTAGTARIWLHKRLILWLYVINLGFAAVLVVPLRKILGEIAKTDLADRFVTGFPADVGLEFWWQNKLAFKALALVALGLGVFYLLFNIFAGGGIVAALAMERRVSLRRFLNDAARYFWRYLRLFVLLVIVVGLVGAGYQALLSDKVEALRENVTTDRASFLWLALVAVVILAVFAFVLMVFDYAKIRTVVDRRRSMFLATLVGLGFSLRRFWQTIPLFGMNFVVIGILFVVYLLIENQFSNATVASMIGLFVVQQIFILSRVWMRLSFFSSQLALYQSVGRKPGVSKASLACEVETT